MKRGIDCQIMTNTMKMNTVRDDDDDDDDYEEKRAV